MLELQRGKGENAMHCHETHDEDLLHFLTKYSAFIYYGTAPCRRGCQNDDTPGSKGVGWVYIARPCYVETVRRRASGGEEISTKTT